MKELLKPFYLLFLLLSLPLFGDSQFSSYCGCDTFHACKLQSADTLHFGRLWKQIKRLDEMHQLDGMIAGRRQELSLQKEHWREKITLLQTSPFQLELERTLENGRLSPSDSGCGGAYILYDHEDYPRFVVKPVDEDILCLNNRKLFASPYNDRAFRVRSHIPLYRSPQTEALSYRFSELLETTHLSPQTSLAIISSSTFHDIGDWLDPKEREAFYAKTGPADREKLCSVQRFLPHKENLFDLIQDWVDEDLSEESVCNSLDQQDFEDLMLFIWCIYDTDGHVGNFPASKDAKGTYHLKKIDNGLAFPNENSNLFNVLYFLPHARTPLSLRMRERIQELPIEAMVEAIYYFEMEGCLEAFKERIDVLQELGKRDNMTLSEIDMRLRALQLPDGKELALGKKSLCELEALIFRRPEK